MIKKPSHTQLSLLSFAEYGSLSPASYLFILVRNIGNYGLDLESVFGLLVHSCTHWLRPRNPPPLLPPPPLGSY
jgi:hypothetical protein